MKNHVREREKGTYPMLQKIGEDGGENPDGSLIASRKLPQAKASAITAALLALGKDGSARAAAARDALKIRGYVPATEADFAHTLALLRRAGVTPDFAFAF